MKKHTKDLKDPALGAFERAMQSAGEERTRGRLAVDARFQKERRTAKKTYRENRRSIQAATQGKEV